MFEKVHESKGSAVMLAINRSTNVIPEIITRYSLTEPLQIKNEGYEPFSVCRNGDVN